MYRLLDSAKKDITCANQVQTNIFPDLVAARYVRLLVSTSLRWVGHDTKCFR